MRTHLRVHASTLARTHAHAHAHAHAQTNNPDAAPWDSACTRARTRQITDVKGIQRRSPTRNGAKATASGATSGEACLQVGQGQMGGGRGACGERPRPSLAGRSMHSLHYFDFRRVWMQIISSCWLCNTCIPNLNREAHPHSRFPDGRIRVECRFFADLFRKSKLCT